MLVPKQQDPRYRLRWRFDYANRPTKVGKWSHPGTTRETQAKYQAKEGLVRAAIEAEDLRTQQVVVAAECDGHDYVTFQWMAEATVAARLLGVMKPVHALVGMALVTRERKIQVYGSGRILEAPRTEDEKRINFATFGR